MNPYPAKHSVLVLDNCAIHHIDAVADLTEKRQVFAIYSKKSIIDARTLTEVSNLCTFHRTPLIIIQLRKASQQPKLIFVDTAKSFDRAPGGESVMKPYCGFIKRCMNVSLLRRFKAGFAILDIYNFCACYFISIHAIAVQQIGNVEHEQSS